MHVSEQLPHRRQHMLCVDLQKCSEYTGRCFKELRNGEQHAKKTETPTVVLSLSLTLRLSPDNRVLALKMIPQSASPAS